MKELISLGAYLVEKYKRRKRRREIARERKIFAEESSVCLRCEAEIGEEPLYRSFRICPLCGFHHSLSAWERIKLLADPLTFREIEFPPPHAPSSAALSYPERLREARERTGLDEAVIVGTCAIGGNPAILFVFDFGFLGGSIGVEAGERLAFAFELGARRKLPVVGAISSLGVRIEESPLSLAQMGKIVAAREKLSRSGMPFISVLCNPVCGEALGGLGFLGDFVIAEPGALVSFSPPGAEEGEFGTAEFQFKRGMIDQIVPRSRLRLLLSLLLSLLKARPPLRGGEMRAPLYTPPPHSLSEILKFTYREDRPSLRDFLPYLVQSFIELHGDRSGGDERYFTCGLAEFGEIPVVVVGEERREEGAFARGLLKARRALEIARKFRLPVVIFIDSRPDASFSEEEESKGLGYLVGEISRCLSDLPAPVITVILGEGRTEELLSFGIADRILMLENAVLTAFSPERAAYIFFEDGMKAPEIAQAFRLTARESKEFQIADVVIPEPEGGAHADPAETALTLRRYLLAELHRLGAISPKKLQKMRYRKLQSLGFHRPLSEIAVLRQTSKLQALLREGVAGLRLIYSLKPPKRSA